MRLDNDVPVIERDLKGDLVPVHVFKFPLGNRIVDALKSFLRQRGSSDLSYQIIQMGICPDCPMIGNCCSKSLTGLIPSSTMLRHVIPEVG